MNKPILIKDALSINEFNGLWNELNPKSNPWNLSNRSTMSNDDNAVSWLISQYCHLPFYRAASTIRMKLERKVQKPLTLVKIHTNGQTSNQVSKFHVDYDTKDTFFTSIFFAKPDWNTQWGGNFTCYDGSDYHIFPYIPNQAVVIPSEWDHYGESPSAYTHEMRITVAFMYCLSERLSDMKNKYPLKVIHHLKAS